MRSRRALTTGLGPETYAGDMSRTTAPFHRRMLVAGAATAALVIGSACGADEIAERGIEELAEREGGGDVDIDLDSGEFSVATEDGSMTRDEDGNFVITDESGEVVVGDGDDDGNINVESEDGSFSAGAATAVPDDWPSDVPEPDGLTIEGAASTNDGGTLGFVVTGQTDDPDFADDYGSALESAGFEVETEFTSEGAVQRQYGNGTWGVAVGLFGDGSAAQVTITVFSVE